MAVSRSSDGGLTWTATYFAPQTGEGQFNDKPMITVDTGSAHHNRIYVAWDNATGNSSSIKNGNNVVVSYSDDGGVSFSTPVSVSGNFIGKTGGIGADPYVTSDGTLHVAWQDYAHLVIADASSTDGGNTFSAPHAIALIGAFQFNVAAQSTRGALVYPACGSYRSSLYCSYTNGSDAATSVYVAKSTDGGATWSSKAVPGTGDQFNQWLAVDQSDGSVNVAYYDTGTHGATSTSDRERIDGRNVLRAERESRQSVRGLRRSRCSRRDRAPGLDRPAPGCDRSRTAGRGLHRHPHAVRDPAGRGATASRPARRRASTARRTRRAGPGRTPIRPRAGSSRGSRSSLAR